MKTFITHSLHDHPEEILKSSLRNCHAIGLHSLVFENGPRKIRMFYTDTKHELWKNTPEDFSNAGLSLGFHPHHCNITLAPLVGKILNWNATEDIHGDLELEKYRFASHIRSGAGGFELLERDVRLKTKDILTLRPGESIFLSAKTMHTVGVERGEQAAWMVYEGKENPQHDERCYSNIDLTNWTPEGLYHPYPHIDSIHTDLVRLGILS